MMSEMPVLQGPNRNGIANWSLNGLLYFTRYNSNREFFINMQANFWLNAFLSNSILKRPFIIQGARNRTPQLHSCLGDLRKVKPQGVKKEKIYLVKRFT